MTARSEDNRFRADAALRPRRNFATHSRCRAARKIQSRHGPPEVHRSAPQNSQANKSFPRRGRDSRPVPSLPCSQPRWHLPLASRLDCSPDTGAAGWMRSSRFRPRARVSGSGALHRHRLEVRRLGTEHRSRGDPGVQSGHHATDWLRPGHSPCGTARSSQPHNCVANPHGELCSSRYCRMPWARSSSMPVCVSAMS